MVPVPGRTGSRLEAGAAVATVRGVILAVIVPTTHMVEDVEHLLSCVRAEAPCEVRAVVVDNGPEANDSWSGVDVLVVERHFLGSEGGFRRGLEAAGVADRYLTLDQDASLGDGALGALLDVAARHPDSVVSGNLLGKRFGWGGKRPLGDLLDLDFAPWTGMLLTAKAKDAIVDRAPSGYFFLFDDTWAVMGVREAGIDVIGVPDAFVGNGTGSLGEYNGRESRAAYFDRAPWRSYYAARNELLFARDCSVSRRAVAGLVKRDLWWMARRLRGGHVRSTLAIGRGTMDGLRNHRGFRMAPDYGAH